MGKALDFLLPWDSQPQEVVEVDWNNPLTNGLVFLAPLWPGQLNDIVGGKRATVTGTLGYAATRDGVFPLFSGSQYIDYGAFGAEFPAGPATIAWIQTPIAQSGFNTLMNLMPSGGVNSWVCYQNGGGGSYAFTFGRRAGTGPANYNTTVGTPANGDTRRFIVRSPSLDTATYTDYSLFDRFSGALAPDGSTTYGGNTSTGMRIGALLPSGGDGFDGAIGMVAIWKRQLSDAEARDYNANPWQLFAPRTIWVPVSAGGGGTEVGLSTETDASLALPSVHIQAAGLSTETDTALAPPGALVAATGRADETDAALSLGAVHAAAFGVAVETDEAFELTGPAAGAVGRADEADTALALDAVHSAPFGIAEENDAALAPESPTTDDVASQGGRRRKPKRLSYQEYDVPIPPEVLTSTIPQDTPPTGIEPAPIPSKLKPASKLATRPARVKAPKVEAPAPLPSVTPEPQAAPAAVAPVVTAAAPVPAVAAPTRPLMLSDILAAESMTNDEILRAMKVLARLHIGPQLRRDMPKPRLIRG